MYKTLIMKVVLFREELPRIFVEEVLNETEEKAGFYYSNLVYSCTNEKASLQYF